MMIKECLTIILALMTIQAEDSSCPHQFISIGKFCYFFSDAEMNWEEAGGACKGIGNYINETVKPAVLDFGSTHENQLLLTEVHGKQQDYWLGGKKIQGKWKWASEDDVDIDLHANYWGSSSSRGGDCIKIGTGFRNSCPCSCHIRAIDCSTQLKVICQIIPKKYGFRDIGNQKYYFSKKNNIKGLQWQKARNVCQSIEPPQDFDYVDLAILTDDTDQQFMKIIAQYGYKVWLGGINNGSKTGEVYLYAWLNGKDIDENSYFWKNEDILYYTQSNYAFVYATVFSAEGHSRAVLATQKTIRWERTPEFDFVCQAYKNITLNQG